MVEEDSDDALVGWEVVCSFGCGIEVCWDCGGGRCEED